MTEQVDSNPFRAPLVQSVFGPAKVSLFRRVICALRALISGVLVIPVGGLVMLTMDLLLEAPAIVTGSLAVLTSVSCFVMVTLRTYAALLSDLKLRRNEEWKARHPGQVTGCNSWGESGNT